MSIYTCQCTHVKNHASASESRGMDLWDVRQLLKSVMIKKKVLQKKVSYDKKKSSAKKGWKFRPNKGDCSFWLQYANIMSFLYFRI